MIALAGSSGRGQNKTMGVRGDTLPGAPSLEQVKAFRQISGEERLRLAEHLYWVARKIKAAGLRSQHPNCTEQPVNAEVTRIFRRARS
jgi:hypothetical protein